MIFSIIYSRLLTTMKSFSKQFLECKKYKLQGTVTLENASKFLPCCPRKRRELLKENKDKISLVSCLKFGGVCSTLNSKCTKLRANK